MLTTSSLSRKVNDKLVTPFNVMTTFYFRRSIEKAFQLDEQPPELTLNPKQPIGSNPPHITSAVDDVMYIVKQVVERSLITSQTSVMISVLPTLTRVLGSDFVGMIQRKMRDESYPKATIQGAPPAEQTVIAFLVLINNLDVATDYVKQIVQSRFLDKSAAGPTDTGPHEGAKSLATLFPFESDANAVTHALLSFQTSFEAKTSELISDGIFVIFKNVMKPRLRPILSDAFRDVDYQQSEDELSGVGHAPTPEENPSAAGGGVLPNFERGWDMLIRPVARILTERNYEKLLATLISYLGEVLEKRIWSFYDRVTGLGAVKLERDINSIVNVVVKGGRYGLREAFARCTQICLVMNMEDDEWEEVHDVPDRSNDEPGEWKLNEDERMRARTMLKNRRCPG